MFGIGYSELLLVVVIIIIFVRPEDLPKFFRFAGRMYGKIKKTYKDIMSVRDRIVKELEDSAKLVNEATDFTKEPAPKGETKAPPQTAALKAPASVPPASAKAPGAKIPAKTPAVTTAPAAASPPPDSP
jgi:sec-independent protein translocase protein TatB